MPGGKFSDEELRVIDTAYRGKRTARCPLDEKPLLSTAWDDRRVKMVYFVCRACSRIGAIGYDNDDPNAPGIIARGSRPTSRPPPER